MYKQLFILISTIDERIMQVRNIIQEYDKNIHYIISHQVSKKNNLDIEQYCKEIAISDNITYSRLEDKGVAKNRNNTLRFIRKDAICLILDDDIQLCADIFPTIIQSFEQNPEADFISFKILDLEGHDYKPYPKEKQWHTIRTLTGIGTTEMAFKSDFILKNNILFDEKFGPGSDIYPIGEDFIVAMDLYKMKTKMLFLPIPIVKHPRVSTGLSFDQKVIFGRGAMFARVFGWKAFVINILFSIKKYSSYSKEKSLFSYLSLLTKGSIDYFRSTQKRVSWKN